MELKENMHKIEDLAVLLLRNKYRGRLEQKKQTFSFNLFCLCPKRESF